MNVKVHRQGHTGQQFWNGNASSQGMYKLNIKALPLMVQNLRQMLKFSDM